MSKILMQNILGPTLLMKMDKALQNSFLTPTALHCHFVALKEEWLKYVDIDFKFKFYS